MAASEHSPDTHPADSEITLSVIVPFYGVEDYIEACLESIRTQLLESIEVILVDDGSPDASVTIAQRYVDADPRFRLITQPNAGLGPARNTGAAAARGRYLTFVDSDDVVTSRGFWTMTHTLDATGSDFAAANAWRFTTERGTYQSWTHEKPFARTELATSLAQRPDLIGDRMVWNKVYRRTFWQEHELAFPPIRYEDYPVTLRAYLSARSVDVLSDHVYLWRDRESGTSITQQKADLGNAQDRYTSAAMALDALEAYPTTDEVLRRVRTYLAWVDVPSLATTMAMVSPAERPTAQRLALDLTARTSTRGLAQAPASVQLINAALQRGDVATAAEVARWRAGGGVKQLGWHTVKSGRPTRALELGRMVVASKAPQHLLRPRRLRTQVTKAHWNNTALELTLDSRLRADVARQVSTHVDLISADGVRHPVETVSEPTGTGVRTHVTLPLSDLADRLGAPVTFEVRMSLPGGAMRWRGHITAEAQTLPSPLRQGTQVLVVSAQPQLAVTAVPATEVVLVQGVDNPATEPSDTLTVQVAADDVVALHVVRPEPTPTVRVAVTAGRAQLRADDLLSGDVSDDPLTPHYTRTVVAERSDGSLGRALLTSEPTTATDGTHTVCLTRSASADAVIAVSPASSAYRLTHNG